MTDRQEMSGFTSRRGAIKTTPQNSSPTATGTIEKKPVWSGPATGAPAPGPNGVFGFEGAGKEIRHKRTNLRVGDTRINLRLTHRPLYEVLCQTYDQADLVPIVGENGEIVVQPSSEPDALKKFKEHSKIYPNLKK